VKICECPVEKKTININNIIYNLYKQYDRVYIIYIYIYTVYITSFFYKEELVLFIPIVSSLYSERYLP